MERQVLVSACQSGHHYSVFMMLSLDAGLKCLMVQKKCSEALVTLRVKDKTGYRSEQLLDTTSLLAYRSSRFVMSKQVRERKDTKIRFRDYIAQGLAPQFSRGQIESCVLLNKSLYTHNFIIVQGFQRHLIPYSSFSSCLIFKRC